jgi:hypothetical protein
MAECRRVRDELRSNRSKRLGICDIRLYDFASARCPDLPFASVVHHGQNRPPGGQKIVRDAAANIDRYPVIAYIVFSLRESPGYSCVFPARKRTCRAVRAEQRNTHHFAGAFLDRLRPGISVEVCLGEARGNQVDLDPG